MTSTDPRLLGERLSTDWAAGYRARAGHATELVEVTLDTFTFLFDIALQRLVGAYGTSAPTRAPRPAARLRGHPSPNRPGAPPTDRGHAIAHSIGGGTDINLIPQLHALNVSREWRSLERYAQQHPGTFVAVHLEYDDDGQRPARLSYSIVRDGSLERHDFANNP